MWLINLALRHMLCLMKFHEPHSAWHNRGRKRGSERRGGKGNEGAGKIEENDIKTILLGVNREAAHVNKWPHLLKPDRHIQATAEAGARQSHGCHCDCMS